MGQVTSAFSNPNTFAADPSGFSGSEWGARFLGAGAKGLGQGLQNYQQQNAQMRQGGGGMPSAPIPQTPAIQFASTNFTPGQKTRNPYFYGYGEGT